MVMWYWSADTLFWKLSTDHNMDVEYQVAGSYSSQKALVQLVLQIAYLLSSAVVLITATLGGPTPILFTAWTVK